MSKPQQLTQAVVDLAPRPTIDAVLDFFFQAAGGADKVGKLLFDEFNSSPPGSLVRNKILELVLRRMERAEERNRVDDFGELTDEDLRVALKVREEAMLKQVAVPPVAEEPPK
jgi:hypothetical protein